MFQADDDPLDIEILMIDGSTLMLLASIIEPLRSANRIAGQPRYRWTVASLSGAPVATASNIPVPVSHRFEPNRSRAPLFVVASYFALANAPKSIAAGLARAARARTLIAGIESGTLLLARAGLLNGYRATTHWEEFDELAGRYDAIEAVPERFVIDRNRVTAAGASPTFDLMLELIRSREGHAMALEVSDQFIYRGAGHSSEPQLAGRYRTSPADDPRVSSAIAIMENATEAALPIALIAKKVGVSARKLQDLFKAGTGELPGRFYRRVRFNKAMRLLIETRMPMLDIALACGFGSLPAFSRAWRHQFSEPPTKTRKRGRTG